MKKQTVFIDMDNVLVNFKSALPQIPTEILENYEDNYDEIPNIFGKMLPMPNAIESYHKIAQQYDTYILSTAPWENPTAWHDKVVWVQQYLGDVAYKRLILSHYKNLCIGDYLIDDRTKNGADKFTGKLLQFGTAEFPTWTEVCNYLGV